MRSNALRKQEFFEEMVEVATPKSWEMRRREIAQASEAACNLPGNMNDPDFEEFLSVSDFA